MAFYQEQAIATGHEGLDYGYYAGHNLNDIDDAKHYMPLNMDTNHGTTLQMHGEPQYEHVYLYPTPVVANNTHAFSAEKSFNHAAFITPDDLNLHLNSLHSSHSKLTAVPASPTPGLSDMPESSYGPQSTRNSSPSPSAVSDEEDASSPNAVKPIVAPNECGQLGGVWAQLLFQCLLDAPNHEMTLREIYDWMKTFTSRCGGKNSSGWENSVRHNLSMNPAFQKGSLFAQDDDDDDESDNQHVWHLEPWAITQGVKPTTRFRKGVNNKGHYEDDEDDEDTPVRRSTAHRRKKNTRVNVRRRSGVTKKYNKKQLAGSRGGHATAEHERRIATRLYTKLMEKARRGRENSAHPTDFSRSATPSPVITGTRDDASSFDDAMSVSTSSYAPSIASTEPYYLAPHQRPVMPASVVRMPPMQRAMTASPFAGATYMVATPPLRAQSNPPVNAALQPFLRRQMSGRPFQPLTAPRHGVSSPWQYALQVSGSAAQLTPELVVTNPGHQMMHSPMSDVVGHHDLGLNPAIAAFDNDVPDMDIGEIAYPSLVPNDLGFINGLDHGLMFGSENASFGSPDLFSTYMHEHQM